MSRLLLSLLVPGFLWFLVPVSHAQSGPVDITANQLDIQQTKGLATFSGNVVVTQTGFTLQAPKVVADYAGGKSNSTDINSITASGGVTITRTGQGAQAEKATGNTALYSPATKQIILSGNVTLIRGPSSLSGDKLVYDMATGNARVTNSGGPVKARFVPQSK